MSVTKLAVSTRGWSFQSLVESSPNFYPVDRVSAGSHRLQESLTCHEEDGIPLVVEGFHKLKAWPYEMFSLSSFCKQLQSKDISVRNVHNWKDQKIPLVDFITKSRAMGRFAEDGGQSLIGAKLSCSLKPVSLEVERLYGKDAECPSAWEEELRGETLLPSNLFCNGPHDEFRFRPASSRIETLMCYLGIGDTFTPCHKDLCASSGHNLMCYTEDEGSSFWFMTASSEAPAVSAYFHTLQQELDHENHVITLEQLVKAPFKVYVVEQKLGDLVLVPPRSAHQVVNYGGITLKTSWSRMTTRGLAVAYYHELPIYRRVCRPETYRVKSTVYYALKGRAAELIDLCKHQEKKPSSAFEVTLADAINSCNAPSPKDKSFASTVRQFEPLSQTLKTILSLYDAILQDEHVDSDSNVILRADSNRKTFNDEHRVVCDFCEADIFQSFFECKKCGDDSHLGCIICSGCYAEGRTCKCEGMQPTQCHPFSLLFAARMEAITALEQYARCNGKTFNRALDLPERSLRAPSLFRAAYMLHSSRGIDYRLPTRTCTMTGATSTSHNIPVPSTVYCKKCHRSRCFSHILEVYQLHSAEALLLSNADENHDLFHSAHLESKCRWQNETESLRNHQKDGSIPNSCLLLATIAMGHGTGRPLHPERVALGWYDDHIELPPSPKPKLKCYVLVPPLPYRISKRPRLDDDLLMSLDSSPLSSPPGSPTLLVALELPPVPKKQKPNAPSPPISLVISPVSAASSAVTPLKPLSLQPTATHKPLPSRQPNSEQVRGPTSTVRKSNSSTSLDNSLSSSSRLKRRNTITCRPSKPLDTRIKSLPRINFAEVHAEKKAKLVGLHFKKAPMKFDTNDNASPSVTPSSSSGPSRLAEESSPTSRPIPSTPLLPSSPETQPFPSSSCPSAALQSAVAGARPFPLANWPQRPENAQFVAQHIANMGISSFPVTPMYPPPPSTEYPQPQPVLPPTYYNPHAGIPQAYQYPPYYQYNPHGNWHQPQ